MPLPATVPPVGMILAAETIPFTLRVVPSKVSLSPVTSCLSALRYGMPLTVPPESVTVLSKVAAPPARKLPAMSTRPSAPMVTRVAPFAMMATELVLPPATSARAPVLDSDDDTSAGAVTDVVAESVPVEMEPEAESEVVVMPPIALRAPFIVV